MDCSWWKIVATIGSVVVVSALSIVYCCLIVIVVLIISTCWYCCLVVMLYSSLVGWLASFTLGRGVSEKASTEDVLFVEEIEGIPSIEMLGGLLLLLLIIYQDSRH